MWTVLMWGFSLKEIMYININVDFKGNVLVSSNRVLLVYCWLVEITILPKYHTPSEYYNKCCLIKKLRRDVYFWFTYINCRPYPGYNFTIFDHYLLTAKCTQMIVTSNYRPQLFIFIRIPSTKSFSWLKLTRNETLSTIQKIYLRADYNHQLIETYERVDCNKMCKLLSIKWKEFEKTSENDVSAILYIYRSFNNKEESTAKKKPTRTRNSRVLKNFLQNKNVLSFLYNRNICNPLNGMIYNEILHSR